MKHNKIKLAQKFMGHVWLDKDHHDVDDYLIPHLIVESPLKTSIGSVNLLNSFATWFRAFPDLQYREMNIGFRGDWVAIEWAVEGNHLGEFLGISATGKKIIYNGTTNLLIGEDSKINSYQAKVSLSPIIQQISLPKQTTPNLNQDKEDLFSHFNRITRLKLSNRQIECLAFVCLGNNKKAILSALEIQYSTFRTHMDRILPVLGLSSTKEVFDWALSKSVLELLIHIGINKIHQY